MAGSAALATGNVMSHLQTMTASHLAACHAIDCAVASHPWSLETFNRGVQKNHQAHVWLDQAGEVQGFCICLLIADELSVLNIAVSARSQRQGLGRQLLQHALAESRQKGAQEAFLEVRQSNLGAQALYEDLGFNVVGVRENYYPTGPGKFEHALIMARTLGLD